ncbi:MAG TPA: DUF4242 domain-containing protein [Thermoflexus sp.]|nr:DUF4242 domain-containing protein [Thermoflexus sp.]
MALFLVESPMPVSTDRSGIQAALDRLAEAIQARSGALIEAQVTSDRSQLFVILEAPDEATVRQAAREIDLPITLVKTVRLVGQTLEEVRSSQGAVDYIVEWNFPAGLTMEAYLQRKAANSPKYALVPEVRFLRTYVCEDMSKCLCFYDAENVEDVLKARQAVEAPVDAVYRVGSADKEQP